MFVADFDPPKAPWYQHKRWLLLVGIVLLVGVVSALLVRHQHPNSVQRARAATAASEQSDTTSASAKAASGQAGASSHTSAQSGSGSHASSASSSSSTSSGSTGSNGSTSGSSSSGSSSGSSSSSVTLHYTANIGSSQSLAASLGFNLFDVAGSQSNPSGINSTVNALPSGAKALVWVGNLDNTNCTPGFSYAQFTAQVDALKNNSRVFGYYLSDEPHPSICSGAASDIKARADYISAHAPAQKSFIVVLDGSNMCGSNLGCEYSALAPSKTDVDYIGLDPYPCHYAADQVTAVACDNSEITQRVTSALASGIPLSAIIPTFQTFGQAGRTDGKTVYYRMPSASELSSMISTWHGLVPNPAFDYAYSFGVQCGSSCPAPEAIANTSAIQTVVADHNK